MTLYSMKNTAEDEVFENLPKTNAVFHLIDHHIELGEGHVTALINRNNGLEELSFNMFLSVISHFSTLLKQHGVTEGDKVLVLLTSNKQSAYLLLAIIRLGAVAVLSEEKKERLTEALHVEKVKYVVTDFTSRHLIDVKKSIELQQILLLEHMNQLPKTKTNTPVTWVKATQPMLIYYSESTRQCYCHGHIRQLIALADKHLIQTEETVLVSTGSPKHPLCCWLAWVKGANSIIEPVSTSLSNKLDIWIVLIDEKGFQQVIASDSEMEALLFNQTDIVNDLLYIGSSNSSGGFND